VPSIRYDSSELGRLDDDVGVLNSVAGADEANGAGDPFLEVDVRLKVDARAGESRGEFFLNRPLVGNEEFLCHINLTYDEVGADGGEHIEYARNAVSERDIDDKE